MKPVILMRASLAEEDELAIAQQHFEVYQLRSEIPKDSLVIGRYSVLPFHKELELDVTNLGSTLLNSTKAHNYVADISSWYWHIGKLTFPTWVSLEHFKKEVRPGSFVLKGQTNSKKQLWNTHMFAETQEDVDRVYSELEKDGYLSDQNIVIRQFVPLRTFDTGIRGLPITEEYRFFVLDKQIVGSGYYWSQYPEVAEEHNLHPDLVPRDFLNKVMDEVQPYLRFYVIDVARTATGEWKVVELNDGCMSGLSMVDPALLYPAMKAVLK